MAAGRREDLARQVPQEVAGPVKAFPASWFRARVVLALRALAGQVEPAGIHDFFALTSVRAFRDLPETGRTHRIRQIDQTVKDLVLT